MEEFLAISVTLHTKLHVKVQVGYGVGKIVLEVNGTKEPMSLERIVCESRVQWQVKR